MTMKKGTVRQIVGVQMWQILDEQDNVVAYFDSDKYPTFTDGLVVLYGEVGPDNVAEHVEVHPELV